jgi:sugar/nucleoside kinase (ribokinase family)
LASKAAALLLSRGNMRSLIWEQGEWFVPAFNVETADNNATGDALNEGGGTVASFTVLYLRQAVFISSRCFN